MECDAFQLKIEAYLDEALPSTEHIAFESHRATCVECRRALAYAQRLGDLLREELPQLATATAAEQVSLRENVTRQLGLAREQERIRLASTQRRWRHWTTRMAGVGGLLALLAVIAFALLPGEEQTASAAEIVNRAQAAVERHQGLNGVLHWEGEWSQRFPSPEQITRTFEIWFSFDSPERYRLTRRDHDGHVYSEMVRDGVDHMWQLSRAVLDDGTERILVDEIILSPQEMEELGSWYVPAPFLDDLGRFIDAVQRVEKSTESEVAGRRAYILRGRVYSFGHPNGGNRMAPVTSTVQLVVDAETYWILGRTEWLPVVGGDQEAIAGIVQQTRRFALLSPDQVPTGTFDFSPPPGAEVHIARGTAGYFAPYPDVIDLDSAAVQASFEAVLPSDLPDDLQPRPVYRQVGSGQAGTFGIVYVGKPGRQAVLLEYAHSQLPGRAARLLTIGEMQGWLVPDPIDRRRFSLYLMEPRPVLAPDGRSWPGSVELQTWGLSLDEALMMLGSLEPSEQ